jgi:hypothetical protein
MQSDKDFDPDHNATFYILPRYITQLACPLTLDIKVILIVPEKTSETQ